MLTTHLLKGSGCMRSILDQTANSSFGMCSELLALGKRPVTRRHRVFILLSPKLTLIAPLCAIGFNDELEVILAVYGRPSLTSNPALLPGSLRHAPFTLM